jgi:cytoskeleton protein RodZ
VTTESHDPVSPSIGAAVAAAREASGLSVADVSERTRVRASVISEIESDNFSHCGGDVYAKGHLRAIGAAVGADASEWVAEYDRRFGSAAPSATEVFESETFTPVRIRRGVNWSAIMAAALVIAVGLVVLQISTSSDAPTRDTTTVAEPEPTPTDTPSAEPSEDPTEVAQAEPQDVTVRIATVAGGASWVQVSSADGTVIYSDTLAGGASKTFRDDKRLDFVIGNAAGVELTVNGQDIGSPGGSGEVARLQFTPKDPDGTAG